MTKRSRRGRVELLVLKEIVRLLLNLSLDFPSATSVGDMVTAWFTFGGELSGGGGLVAPESDEKGNVMVGRVGR